MTPKNGRCVPADTSGFFDFSGQTPFNRVFTVRGLPSLRDDGQGGLIQPAILFWNDAGHGAGEPKYMSAFAELGLVEGHDFDTYTTKNPETLISSVGLGMYCFCGATAGQITGYNTLVYTCGEWGANTFVGHVGGCSDVAVLTDWHNQAADRYAVYFGDNFAKSMGDGSARQAYRQDIMGVVFQSDDVRAAIEDQTEPLVVSTGEVGGGFFTDFIVSGGCPDLNQFDAVLPVFGAVSGHDFTDPNGVPYSPVVSASVWHERTQNVDGTDYRRVDVTFPIDLQFVETHPPWRPGISARTELLGELLAAFAVDPNPCQVLPRFIDVTAGVGSEIPLGGSKDSSFAVINTGSSTLTGTIVEPASPHFSSVPPGNKSYSLAPGDTARVTVRFEPQGVGTHTEVVETGNGACADVALQGSTPPICSTDLLDVDFGMVAVGSAKDTTIVINNIGGGQLLVELHVDSSAHYAVISPPDFYSTTGILDTLGAGDSLELTVRFAPTSVGVHTLLITRLWWSDCADQDISFTGHGGTTWYVDLANVSGPWDGTPTHPFRSVADAYDAASDGDRIIIRAGIYSENIIMTKQLRIESEGGVVRIGAP